MQPEARYSIKHGHDGKYYADGPGSGNGFYSGTLWPQRRFDTAKEVEIITEVANEAFRAGVFYAQHEIQKALGLVKE